MPNDLSNASTPIRHVSELPTARERFLARVLDEVLQDGWRTPEDFLRHFSPAQLMESLAQVNDLRVKLLVAATGMHERIALRKSTAGAGEDLQIALDEGTTDAATLVGLYPTDDKVRYLDAKKLWAFITEDRFFKIRPDDDRQLHTRAAARLTFMIECAMSEELLIVRDVGDGMTFDEVASSLPLPELQLIVKHALQIGRADAPLTEDRLLSIVPLSSLVEFVALEHTWDRVIIDKVAVPCAFVDETATTSLRSSPPAVAERVSPVPPPMPPPPAAAAPKSSPAASPGSEPPARKSERVDGDDARRRVIERLRAAERLPPRIEHLSTPILLSIESMYADLTFLTDDDEREACVRESFPNESHLRAAMLGLIELLDPSVDTQDPVIRDADVTGLIKIVLFEERRRGSANKGSGLQTGPSSRRARRSMPPPLPKTPPSQPPPPLDESPRPRRLP